MNIVYTKLKEFGELKVNVSLAKKTTFKIGGSAQYFLTVDTVDRAVELFRYLDGAGISYMILGGGSNMLASDEGYEGVIVHIADKRHIIDGTSVTAAAGLSTVELAQISIKAGLTGFEWGVGVPGTIGGAARGNAGAMGSDMSTCVTSVEAYVDGAVELFSHEQCGFAYRESAFKQNGGVVLRVTLGLRKAENANGMKEALSYLQYRNKTQPQGFASTGCIFKNPDTVLNKAALLAHADEQNEKVQQFLRVGKISAGWLVEQVGMKGVQVGNAKVSETHGNFIVNLGGATAQDVHSLIEEIKTKVYSTFGIALEEEIQLI